MEGGQEGGGQGDGEGETGMGRREGGQRGVGGGGVEELARARSREGEVGRVDKKEWGGRGETGRGAMGRGRWRLYNEGGDGRGRRRGKRRGHFTDGYDGMSGWI